MIYHRKFWTSTGIVALFIICYQGFGISWISDNFSSFMVYEVETGLGYYRTDIWMMVFSSLFILYWSINIELDSQMLVRMQTRKHILHDYLIKSWQLGFMFISVYWVVPLVRLLFLSISVSDYGRFVLTMTGQSILMLTWVEFIIMITLTLKAFLKTIGLLPIGLLTLAAVTGILLLPMFRYTLLVNLQYTLGAESKHLFYGLIKAGLVEGIYLSLIWLVYYAAVKGIQKWEWVK